MISIILGVLFVVGIIWTIITAIIKPNNNRSSSNSSSNSNSSTSNQHVGGLSNNCHFSSSKKKQTFSLPSYFTTTNSTTAAVTTATSTISDDELHVLKNKFKLSASACMLTFSMTDNDINTLADSDHGNIDRHNIIETVKILSKISIVFVLCRANSDEQQAQIQCIVDATLGIDAGIPSHRVLFHQTIIGKIAIVRQLKSAVHIDSDGFACNALAPHIKSIVKIGEATATNASSINNTTSYYCVPSLSRILSVHSQ